MCKVTVEGPPVVPDQSLDTCANGFVGILTWESRPHLHTPGEPVIVLGGLAFFPRSASIGHDLRHYRARPLCPGERIIIERV